jgi:CcmD family protein
MKKKSRIYVMSMIKRSFLAAALLTIALCADPFAGDSLSQTDAGTVFAQAQSGQPAKLNSAQPSVSEKDQPTDAAAVLYRVMGVVLIVWIGLALFLFRIDRKLTRLEKEVRGLK